MKKEIVTVLFFLPFAFLIDRAQATMQSPLSCPTKFVGLVEDIKEIESTGFQKIEVSFKVLQNLKGETFASKKIQIVKDGPVEFKNGKTYQVETRDQWLCKVGVVSSN
jgi:hypothetical protein